MSLLRGARGPSSGQLRHHERLVAHLRAHDVGAPDLADEGEASQASLLQRLDMALPLLPAAMRCGLVRSLVALALGAVLLCVAGGALLSSEVSSAAGAWLVVLVVGLSLAALGLRACPGGVAFLEVRTEAGFYSNEAGIAHERNRRLRNAFEAWTPTCVPTPYLRTGELCSVALSVCKPRRGRGLTYERVWLEDPEDRERTAMDWVFPRTGYNPDKPVVLVLTGMMPSRHWTEDAGFVADVAWHLTAREGATVAVLVVRGAMGTGVREHLYHGARVSDVRLAVLLAEAAMRAAREERAASALPLFGVGFSMGGIMLSNYCGRFGADARLRGGIHFSGVYDVAAQNKFEYSTKTWQTFLCYSMKPFFCRGRAALAAAERGVDMGEVMSRRVRSMADFDEAFVAPFNGYRDLGHYYRDLGVAGDEKWRQVRVPLLAVAARDDPITHCDALRAAEFSRGNDNLLFLITGRGGHCGWPLGWAPWRRGFDFANEAISMFLESVLVHG